jgi:hypothetical protein
MPSAAALCCWREQEQALKRATGDNNHGVGWGMTAVEMGLLRMSALGQGKVSWLHYRWHVNAC